MTPPVSEEEEEEALKKEQHPSHKKGYWQNELESLGVEAVFYSLLIFSLIIESCTFIV